MINNKKHLEELLKEEGLGSMKFIETLMSSERKQIDAGFRSKLQSEIKGRIDGEKKNKTKSLIGRIARFRYAMVAISCSFLVVAVFFVDKGANNIGQEASYEAPIFESLISKQIQTHKYARFKKGVIHDNEGFDDSRFSSKLKKRLKK